MKITQGLVLLCVSLMRPALAASWLLFFATLPFETAAARRSDILSPKPELRAVILFVCHLALSQFFALV